MTSGTSSPRVFRLLAERNDRGGTDVRRLAPTTWRKPAFDFSDFKGPATDDNLDT